MAGSLEHVEEITRRVADSLGVQVVELEMRGSGKFRTLRIFIDKPGGVTHEDCASLSREVGTIFDVEDAVPGGSYTLEVSSPGLDRKLLTAADFERYTGSKLKLVTKEPVNNNRFFEGRLERFDGRELVLDVATGKKKKPGQEARHVIIELANVERANLVPEI
ncbi:MAG: ribosome maturation factor RimP [Acidobacteriales bacterium]|nr:ribosome maturation factor RimP [Terriglobales bacterium]